MSKEGSPHEYRVRWWYPARSRPGFRTLVGEFVTGWTSSRNRAALKRVVDAKAWPDGTVLEVGMVQDGMQVAGASMLCRPEQVRRWNPENQELPDADPGARIPIPLSTHRLIFLRDVENSAREAVAYGVLQQSDADALLIACRDAVERLRLRREDG